MAETRLQKPSSTGVSSRQLDVSAVDKAVACLRGQDEKARIRQLGCDPTGSLHLYLFPCLFHKHPIDTKRKKAAPACLLPAGR